MKKTVAILMVALMLCALASSALALVADTPASYKNPPLFVSGLTVSDAWMSGLTVQNWQGALTNQTYAEGSYIWFVAKVTVSASGDSDADHMWDGESDGTPKLTISSKGDCLNFITANTATFAKISGMNVVARKIVSNDTDIVEASEKNVVFKFKSQRPSKMHKNGTLVFDDEKLSTLRLDAIYGSDVVEVKRTANFVNDYATLKFSGQNSNFRTGEKAPENNYYNRATNQKDYYLHFMAITKAATSGVCTARLKLNGKSEFERNTAKEGTDTENFSPSTQAGSGNKTASYSTANWYDNYKNAVSSKLNDDAREVSDTKLLPGDRSIPYLLYNDVNGKTYSVAKIHGEATKTSKANGWRGPYENDGSIYLLMNKNCDELIIGFVVAKNKFQGLVAWNEDYRNGKTDAKAGKFNFLSNKKTWDSAYYIPMMSNDYSGNLVQLASAYRDVKVGSAELQAIFDFFGFAYVNPAAPNDGDFLDKSALITKAEAKYNVS